LVLGSGAWGGCPLGSVRLGGVAVPAGQVGPGESTQSTRRKQAGVRLRPVGSTPKILVSRLSAMGDVVRTVPAVKALREFFSTSEMHWLVEDRCAPIVDGLKYVDRIRIVPRREWSRLPPRRRPAALLNFVRSLRTERYDLYLDFHGLFKSGAYGYLAGIPRRLGYPRGLAREFNFLLTTEKVPAPTGRLSRYERNHLIPRHFAPNSRIERADLPITPEDEEFALRLIEREGLQSGEFAVFYPGTSPRGRLRRWPPERYGAAIRALWSRRGLPTVVGWGPGEESLVDEVLSYVGGRAAIPPATSLRQLAAVIRKAAVFVGGDTGFLHVASMVGTPVVAILGPSDPVVNEPGPFTPFRLLHAGVDCSPCRRRLCRGRECMNAVTPDMVIVAVEDLLGRPQAVSEPSASKT
jgi:heptosyltransferase I